MRILSRQHRLIVLAVLVLMTPVTLSAQTIDLPNTARAVSGESVIYEFTFAYPEGWQLIEMPGFEDVGGIIASAAQRDGNPESLIMLTVVSTRDVQSTSDSIYPLPVREFDLEVDSIERGNVTITVRRGALFDGSATFIALQPLTESNFALLQAAVPVDFLSSSEDVLLAVLDSVRLDSVRGAVNDQRSSSRLCNFDVIVSIDSVEVINAEEAGTGADFGFDGDQIRLFVGLGPQLENEQVDVGLQGEFQFIWEADLASGQVVSDGSIGSIQRVLCDPEVGFRLALTEDDSTPFRRIETQLGRPVIIPILTNGEPADENNAGEYTISGSTQDGNFEYRIGYTTNYTAVNINAVDLTPTLQPTRTQTPTATLTQSPTFTASSSPTPSPTPSPAPSFTPTIDYTQLALEFSATQTAFAVTQTAVIATFTPSPTATLDEQSSFFGTQTAFARTQIAFSTLSAPTITPSFTPSRTPTSTRSLTPSATFTDTPTLTPSQTFTATRTASMTYTPSPTLTPTRQPTLTPTPTPVICPGSLQSRLYAGLSGRVVPGQSANRLRAQATRSGAELGLIPGGESFFVVGGPMCADNLTWIQVEYQSVTGWTAEGDGNIYWLEPLITRGSGITVPTSSPDICVAIADGVVNKRDGPGTTFNLIGVMQSGERLEIVGRRTATSGFVWWQLVDTTWVREDAVIESGNCALVPGI